MSLRFGTSGLRGLVTDLLGEPTLIYTTAFARHMVESGATRLGDPVVVGRDLRADSPAIATDCIRALSASGMVPVDCGVIPTPALALYGMSRHAAAIMVTGSHIPADRNGIKFYRPDGEIDKNDEAGIVAIADRVEPGAMSGPLGDVEAAHEAAIDLYRARYRHMLPPGSLKELRIGVYEHSSVARDLLRDVLAEFGAEIVGLGRLEEFIPIDTEAVSDDTVRQLRAWSEEHALDAIVSTDGDGDRPLVADGDGTPLRGDLLGLVSAVFLQADVVVTPITSNSRINGELGFEVIRTKVGSPFVIAGMRAPAEAGGKKVMGFEANGGVLLATAFTVNGAPLAALPTRDGFLPILAALGKSLAAGKPVAALAEEWPLAAAASGRVEHFPNDVAERLLATLRRGDKEIAAFFAEVGTVQSVNELDGLRVTFTTGDVVHLRPSGNAPEMRCYVEAADAGRADRLLAAGLGLLEDYARQHRRSA